MIINIRKGVFGDCIRGGDLIAVGNVVEHLRKVNNNPDIRFWIDPKATSSDRYVQDFHSFLICATDYFSTHEGREELPWRKVNLWDYRDISGDLVKIPNTKEMKKKIVIFPLTDAPYNQWRNWPPHLLPELIKKYNTEEYKDYVKIICSKNSAYYGEEWTCSTDIIDNLNHIMDAEIFIGGDTGTTHFAFALDRAPKDLLYYGSSRALVHTLPFYLLQGKGRVTNYWLDFERTIWQ
jgi:hypothetical protein